MSKELLMLSNHLIHYHLLLLPSVFPSTKVFSKMSWLFESGDRCWRFSFSVNLSNEYSGLISFRIDWFHLFAVQATLKSLFQRHSLKASILWCSVVFMVQLSHPYMTTGKTTILTIRIFVSKVMSLLSNMLPIFVITFLKKQTSFNFMAQS